MCERTGGQLGQVSGFVPGKHAVKLERELCRMVSRPAAHEAVLRVRCCAGLAVDGYYGAFNRTPEGDIEMPCIDADKTLAVALKVRSWHQALGRDEAIVIRAVECALGFASRGCRRSTRCRGQMEADVHSRRARACTHSRSHVLSRSDAGGRAL